MQKLLIFKLQFLHWLQFYIIINIMDDYNELWKRFFMFDHDKWWSVRQWVRSPKVDYRMNYLWLIVSGQRIFFCSRSFSGDIIYLTLAVLAAKSQNLYVTRRIFVVHHPRLRRERRLQARDLGFGARRVFLPPVWPPPRLIFFCLVHCMHAAPSHMHRPAQPARFL